MAYTVTVPAAPGMHWASPVWLMVAMELAPAPIKLHDPVYGDSNVTFAGDGALLNFPVAANCTWPFAKVLASALAGVITID
jgi:hypothetical protein